MDNFMVWPSIDGWPSAPELDLWEVFDPGEVFARETCNTNWHYPPLEASLGREPSQAEQPEADTGH